jgi:hypothetical protein
MLRDLRRKGFAPTEVFSVDGAQRYGGHSFVSFGVDGDDKPKRPGFPGRFVLKAFHI